MRKAMSAAPSDIGISLREANMMNARNLREGLQELRIPKIAINSAVYRPTHMEAAQRHGIEVVLMPRVGHFVMMEDPQTFNRLLEVAVQKFIRARESLTLAPSSAPTRR